MTTLITDDRPVGCRSILYMSPGVVGSVGDVNMQTRFAQSTPALPMRFDPLFAFEREKRLGSNVQNGELPSYSSGGGPARGIDVKWYGNRDVKTAVGWRYQDIRATDRTIQPTVGPAPDFSWTNKLATLYRAQHQGTNFLPLPGGYQMAQGDVPANGSGPVITNVIKPQGYPVDQPRELGHGYTDSSNIGDDFGRIDRLRNEARSRYNYLNGLGPQRVGNKKVNRRLSVQ